MTPTKTPKSTTAPAPCSAAVANALRIVKERLDRAPHATFEKYHMLCAQNALIKAAAEIRDADRMPMPPNEKLSD